MRLGTRGSPRMNRLWLYTEQWNFFVKTALRAQEEPYELSYYISDLDMFITLI